MALREFLLSILGGTLLLGPVVYSILERIAWFHDQDILLKRLILGVFSGAVALAAWSFAMWLGYVPTPGDRVAISEGIWTYGILTGFAAFTGATITHALAKVPQG